MRAWVAMAAGYAFLLQFLLTGIAVTQMAAAATNDALVICSAGGTGAEETAQAAHQACTICMFAYPGLLRPTASAPALRAVVAGRVVHDAVRIAVNAGGWHSPRSSQGPPQNA